MMSRAEEKFIEIIAENSGNNEPTDTFIKELGAMLTFNPDDGRIDFGGDPLRKGLKENDLIKKLSDKTIIAICKELLEHRYSFDDRERNVVPLRVAHVLNDLYEELLSRHPFQNTPGETLHENINKLNFELLKYFNKIFGATAEGTLASCVLVKINTQGRHDTKDNKSFLITAATPNEATKDELNLIIEPIKKMLAEELISRRAAALSVGSIARRSNSQGNLSALIKAKDAPKPAAAKETNEKEANDTQKPELDGTSSKNRVQELSSRNIAVGRSSSLLNLSLLNNKKKNVGVEINDDAEIKKQKGSQSAPTFGGKKDD